MEEGSPVNRYSEPGIYPWGRIVIFILVLVLIEVVMGTAEYGFTVGASEIDALVGVILSVYLIWLVHSLNLKFTHLFFVVWLNLFTIRYLNNILEGYFFSDVFSGLSDAAVSIGYAALFSLLTAVASAIVFMFPRPTKDLIRNLREKISTGTAGGWALRLILAGPLYFVVYFAFGMLVSPFVYQYYNDPALGLKIPAFSVMVPLEIVRGAIYGLVLLPLMSSIRFGKLNVFVCVSMMLFIPGALLPLIQSPLPPEIVPYHILEILGDSLVFGYLLTWLFKAGYSENIRKEEHAAS